MAHAKHQKHDAKHAKAHPSPRGKEGDVPMPRQRATLAVVLAGTLSLFALLAVVVLAIWLIRG